MRMIRQNTVLNAPYFTESTHSNENRVTLVTISPVAKGQKSGRPESQMDVQLHSVEYADLILHMLQLYIGDTGPPD